VRRVISTFSFIITLFGTSLALEYLVESVEHVIALENRRDRRYLDKLFCLLFRLKIFLKQFTFIL
jgi:hypothetical protein